MLHGIRIGARARVAIGVTALAASGVIVTGSTHAFAAETHSDCITFDSGGNVTGITPNCSETVHVVSGPNSMPAIDPCTGGTGVITLNDAHDVFHVTINGAGDGWVTGTDSGTATFVGDDGGPTGSGTWTGWFGGEFNRNNTVMPSTFSVRLTLSDGTHVTVHDNSQFVLTPGGAVISFDHPVATCSG